MPDTEHLIDPDAPYVLARPGERERRKAMLSDSHMRPLTEHVAAIRSALNLTEADVPDFDPCDGGINARVLFLQQDPGAEAVTSGFISRNNPDQTAHNMCCLQKLASLDRGDTLLWNIVPWKVPKKASGRQHRAEVEQAMPFHQKLFAELHCLQVIVLVGKKATDHMGEILRIARGQAGTVRILTSPHTSPLNVNSRPEAWGEILKAFEEVARILYPASECAESRQRP